MAFARFATQWTGILAIWMVTCAAGAQTSTLFSNSGPEKRYALLIGNAAYSSAPLANPVNDVRAMSHSLRSAGFEVVSAENVGRIELLRLVRDFGNKLLISGGVGLFYFAGHGLQIKGRNYLVPVDAQVTGEDEASYDSMDADFVLQKMGEAKNRVNIIILDACRNNPFVKTRAAGGGGLAQMDAPVGSLVAYATAPGSVASDGVGANGLYTQHLVTAIAQKGLAVEEVFKQVRANVRRDSQGKQIPWENTALEGQFFFFPNESVAGVQQLNPHSTASPGPAVLQSGTTEQSAWDAVRMGSAADIERFLQRYGDSRFAPQARERLAAVRVHAPVVTDAVAQAPTSSTGILAVRPLPTVVATATTPQREKISLQALAGMTQQINLPKPSAQPSSNSQTPPTPAAAVVAVISPAGPTSSDSTAAMSSGKVWNYIVSSVGDTDKTEQVRAQATSNGWQQLTNGTEFHEDGRVRAVRFGSYLVKAVSDESFLKMPLRAGQSGVNTAQVIDTLGRTVNARVIWRTESAGELVKLLAMVDGVTFVLRYQAFFAGDQLLPIRYESEIKNRLAGGLTQTITARMQP